MILHELVAYYEILRKAGKIAASGWAATKIGYALCLNANGELTGIAPLMEADEKGKLHQRLIDLPAMRETRTSSIRPNFVWDNAKYTLGIDTPKENPKASEEKKAKEKQKCDEAAAAKFESFRAFHHELLDDVDSMPAKAILSFLDSWNPAKWEENPFVKAEYDGLTSGRNILFRVEGEYAHEDPAICVAWQKHYDKLEGNLQQCLVTGKMDIIPATHPFIMGVKGAQPSGAALVSFNAPAFCSYGHEKSYNAPVGQYAVFAYTSALNYLLQDRHNVQYIGNTTVVCWAKSSADESYQDILQGVLFGSGNNQMTEDDLRDIVRKLAHGQSVPEKNLDPNCEFCILGLDPSSARVSVRFFYKDTFGHLLKNINDHHERMEIVKPPFVKYNTISLKKMLRETGNPNASEPIEPVLAGAFMNALFAGNRYPASLLTNTMLRIRSTGQKKATTTKDKLDKKESEYIRAAIIKAYYIKNPHNDCPKEVLTMALNDSCTNPAYVLGRLFAILEKIQKDSASGELNCTIKDKYMNSASANPGSVFPFLLRLSNAHLHKLKTGSRIWYENQIQALQNVFEDGYPPRLNLAQQGSFILGYYHQNAKLYEKKEEN